MIDGISYALRSLVIQSLVVAERIRSGAAYDPLSRRVTQNPYPTYGALRTHSPVHLSLLMDVWVLTRYTDIHRVLADTQRFSNNPHMRSKKRRRPAALPPGPDDYSGLLVDPPHHTRLRKVVNKGFTRQAVQALEPRVRAHMTRLLDEIQNPASFDFIQAVAQRLPMILITEVLGIPAKDRPKFEVWSKQRARLLELTVSRADREVAMKAIQGMSEYFRPLVKSRRTQPREDLISLLAQDGEEDEYLTRDEAVDMLAVLLVAGNETTANLIGNGMLALLQHEDQLERLREDKSAIGAAVEEMLRYDGPVQVDFRIAREDCEIGGTPIRQGEGLILLLGAANRDPEVFERAEEFDITRGGPSHLAFGRGIHHCVGAPLARLQACMAIEMILDRFEMIRLLEDQPKFRNNAVMRGLKSLEIQGKSD